MLLLFSVAIYAQEKNDKSLVIVTSKSNEALTIQDVKRLYSLKQKYLPNNKRAKLVVLPIDGATTLEFSQSLYGLFPISYKEFGTGQFFLGEVKPPLPKRIRKLCCHLLMQTATH
jgi:hypothetical protein